MDTLVTEFSSNRVVWIVLLVAASLVAARVIRSVMNGLSERYTTKRIAIKNLIPLINISLHIAVLLYISFGVLKLTADTMLALGVSAGVAIGFAVQDVLANVFGGLVIIFTRPFNIGDKIEIGSYYGEVTDISLLKVKLVTIDDSLVSVPSKTFLQSSTSNANAGALDCQVVTTIVVPGALDATLIRTLAYEAVISSPLAYLKKPVVVNMSDHFAGISTVRLRIKAYVFDHRYEGRFASDVTERFKHALDSLGIVPSTFYSGPLWSPDGTVQ